MNNRKSAVVLSLPGLLAVFVLLVLPAAYFLHFAFRTGVHGEFAGWANFNKIIDDSYYLRTGLRTLAIAGTAALLCAVASVPVALMIYHAGKKTKAVLLALSVMPLLSGSVVRAIGWLAILGYSGPVVKFALSIGLLEEEANLAQNAVAVTLVLVSILVPVMVLLLHSALEDMNPDIVKASASLGASRARTFFKVTLPVTAPALSTGMILVFVLALNSYDTPRLIGGNKVGMMTPTIYRMMMEQFNWPGAAVVTIMLLVEAIAAIACYSAISRRYVSAWKRGGVR